MSAETFDTCNSRLLSLYPSSSLFLGHNEEASKMSNNGVGERTKSLIASSASTLPTPDISSNSSRLRNQLGGLEKRRVEVGKDRRENEKAKEKKTRKGWGEGEKEKKSSNEILPFGGAAEHDAASSPPSASVLREWTRGWVP